MTNKPNLLFYSITDNISINILNLLKTYELYNCFKLFNIDENKKHPVLNKINKIPTAILPNENKILIGDEIINYIKSNIIKTNNILGYNDLEMNGYSDKYSFINTNITPIHTYGIFKNINQNNQNNQNNKINKINILNDEIVNNIVLQHNKDYNI